MDSMQESTLSASQKPDSITPVDDSNDFLCNSAGDIMGQLNTELEAGTIEEELV